MQGSLDKLKGKLADQETLVAELRQYTAAVEADLAAAETSAAEAAMTAAAADAELEGREKSSEELRESSAADAELRALEMETLERQAMEARADAEAKAAALEEAQACSSVLEGMLESMADELEVLREDVGVKDHLMAKLRTALALPAATEEEGGDMPSPDEGLVEAVEASVAKAMAAGISNMLLQQQLAEKEAKLEDARRGVKELTASQVLLRAELDASLGAFDELQAKVLDETVAAQADADAALVEERARLMSRLEAAAERTTELMLERDDLMRQLEGMADDSGEVRAELMRERDALQVQLQEAEKAQVATTQERDILAADLAATADAERELAAYSSAVESDLAALEVSVLEVSSPYDSFLRRISTGRENISVVWRVRQAPVCVRRRWGEPSQL